MYLYSYNLDFQDTTQHVWHHNSKCSIYGSMFVWPRNKCPHNDFNVMYLSTNTSLISMKFKPISTNTNLISIIFKSVRDFLIIPRGESVRCFSDFFLLKRRKVVWNFSCLKLRKFLRYYKSSGGLSEKESIFLCLKTAQENVKKHKG